MYRRGLTLRVAGVWDKVVRLSYAPAVFTLQEVYLVLISVRNWVGRRAIVRMKGLCKLEIPVTQSGIEHAIFQLVAQWLKKLRQRVSPSNSTLTLTPTFFGGAFAWRLWIQFSCNFPDSWHEPFILEHVSSNESCSRISQIHTPAFQNWTRIYRVYITLNF